MPDTSADRTPRRLGVAVLVLAVAALVAGLAFAGGEGKEKAHATLKRVETKKVCMINNQVFEKDQIPVEVEGKTYYGCCEMCKERLAKDPASRQAVDPVTGKTVDKATAVIGVLPDGKVLYFESAETLEKYETPAGE
ncbi:MAG TPA: TRASH domain-containing protein [Thermoanaerobaculia bacterium]|nr:TRASH domain-containing protein [Thermoanaerobaculia bacterium]